MYAFAAQGDALIKRQSTAITKYLISSNPPINPLR